MEPTDDPFGAISRLLQAHKLGRDVDAIIVDFHCEATGEKQAMGHFCDGRVSLVVGTHTHTPSADHRVLAGGTAYITDVGMTGDYDSVVGMQKEEPVRRFATGVTFGRFLPAEGAASMCGVAVETDPATGLATCIAPVRLGGPIEQRTPGFWE
jgi:calcineurin-like phosphoesterase